MANLHLNILRIEKQKPIKITQLKKPKTKVLRVPDNKKRSYLMVYQIMFKIAVDFVRWVNDYIQIAH